MRTWPVIAATALLLAGCVGNGAPMRGTTGSVPGSMGGGVDGPRIEDRSRPLCWYSRYHERTVCRE